MMLAIVRPRLPRRNRYFTHYLKQVLRNQSYSSSEELIINHTTISNNNLTPEIKLRLITRNTEAWYTPVAPGSLHPLGEPFWAFYWPGGQGISRCGDDSFDASYIN